MMMLLVAHHHLILFKVPILVILSHNLLLFHPMTHFLIPLCQIPPTLLLCLMLPLLHNHLPLLNNHLFLSLFLQLSLLWLSSPNFQNKVLGGLPECLTNHHICSLIIVTRWVLHPSFNLFLRKVPLNPFKTFFPILNFLPPIEIFAILYLLLWNLLSMPRLFRIPSGGRLWLLRLLP